MYYSAGCLETYLDTEYTEKLQKGKYEDVEPDDIFPKLLDKLSPPVHDKLDAFINALSKDENFKPPGELLHSFTINGKSTTKQQYNH